ncbi:MAG: 16S rRNA (cytosine(1402)-N(4))-methyltransferase RsmH [Pseudomonadota bacterium]
MGHAPVMLKEVLEALRPADGEVHLDGTYGGGGYASAFLAAANITLLAVDRDLDAIARAEAHSTKEPRLVPLLGRFGDMDTIARDAGYPSVSGIALDLGVSSFQLDEADRGFSFMRDGPLDMRMGRAGPSAAEVVNQMDERDLSSVIFRLGEEKRARRIAKVIVQRRTERPFETTLDLAETVEAAVGGRKGARTHPGTLTFQALRMFVNDELGELARGLAAAERLLQPGGRLVVVSFHSLEDRMVKLFFRTRSGGLGAGSRHMPEAKSGPPPSFELTTKKATEPSLDEIQDNPRSRSARLRFAIRTDAPAWSADPAAEFELPAFKAKEASV